MKLADYMRQRKIGNRMAQQLFAIADWLEFELVLPEAAARVREEAWATSEDT